MTHDYERGYRMASQLTVEQHAAVLKNWKRRGYATLAIYVECIGKATPEFARGYAAGFQARP
jgi:hypothetical protein